jgi:hypothetical protein
LFGLKSKKRRGRPRKSKKNRSRRQYMN